MTKLEYSQNALDDIKRLVTFLIEVDTIAAVETFDIIDEAIQILKRHPEIGRASNLASNRELVISRGKTGYIAAYKFDKLTDIVVILAIKHQREVDF
jgi:plasmid stabilization system protein ParE